MPNRFAIEKVRQGFPSGHRAGIADKAFISITSTLKSISSDISISLADYLTAIPEIFAIRSATKVEGEAIETFCLF
jgi:hypothetical protein